MIKKVLFLLVLVFFISCTNTRIMNKKGLSEAIKKDKIEVLKFEDGNLGFFITQNGEKYEFLSKISQEDKGIYGISYIEKATELKKEGKKLNIINSEIWEQTQIKVFDEIVPKESFKGVLFLVYYFELVAYRDSKNQMIFSSLETLPKDVEIVEKYENEKFMDYTLSLLKEFTSDEDDIIFATSTMEQEQMPYVYYDKKNGKLISLYNSYLDGENHQSVSYLIFRNMFGLINNPATVMGRLIFYLYNSAYVLTTQGIDMPKGQIPEIKDVEPLNLDEFLPKVEKIASREVKKGKIDYLIDGESFFFDFINSIKEAKKDILIRTYIFDNDDYAVKVADLLKTKSQDVEIKILMDEFGSMSAAMTNPKTPMPIDFVPPRRIDQYLEKDSKINSRTAKNPWFTTDHNKVMVFDKKLAYMGGMNIGKEYRYEWHDMMIKTEGPIVGTLTEDFYAAWSHAGPLGDLGYLARALTRNEDYKLPIKDDYIDILPIYTKTGKTEILQITLAAIKNSKKEILIENAYFSDDQVIQELINARQRGVDVKVILPYWGNHEVMNSSNMVTANILIKSGIKVYLYPKMNHVKASIFDGFAMVGTANYDKISMRVNQEINFCFWDKNIVEKLKIDLFEKDLKESMLVSGEFPILWVDYLLEKWANQL